MTYDGGGQHRELPSAVVGRSAESSRYEPATGLATGDATGASLFSCRSRR